MHIVRHPVTRRIGEALLTLLGVSILTFFPPEERPADEKITALLRAAERLSSEDLEELRRYAEFRRARHLYGKEGRPQSGRKRKGSQ